MLLLWGFAMTFVSGAEEAWVVDNLKHYKRTDLTDEFYIKTHSILNIGAVFLRL